MGEPALLLPDDDDDDAVAEEVKGRVDDDAARTTDEKSMLPGLLTLQISRRASITPSQESRPYLGLTVMPLLAVHVRRGRWLCCFMFINVGVWLYAGK